MPVVQIDWFEGRNQEQKRKLVEVITTALVEIGGTRPENVEIIFRDIPKSSWGSKGKLCSDSG